MHRHSTVKADLPPRKINLSLACLKTELGTAQILYIFSSWAGRLARVQRALPDTAHASGRRYVHQAMGRVCFFFHSRFQPQTHSWGFSTITLAFQFCASKQLHAHSLVHTPHPHTPPNSPPPLPSAQLHSRNGCLFMTH